MKADKRIINIIKSGGVGVLPTDTLYGLVGSAMDKKTVARIYRLKKRTPKKPCIILISKINDLKKFSVKINKTEKAILERLWPGKVSVVLPCPERKFFYLHRGTNSLAFRLPAKKSLLALLKKTGPLLAPSANLESFPPAKNLAAAKKYFGDGVDFYIGGEKLESKPSTLITLKNGALKVLRTGAVKI
jgi:L-threonylcarbamoyladenylate synthase